MSAKKEVDEIDLGNHVDKVEYLAQKKGDGVKIVRVHIGGKIVDHKFQTVFAFLSDNWVVEVLHEVFYFIGLPSLPQEPGNIKHDCLEKKHEAYPLIVFVM